MRWTAMLLALLGVFMMAAPVLGADIVSCTNDGTDCSTCLDVRPTDGTLEVCVWCIEHTGMFDTGAAGRCITESTCSPGSTQTAVAASGACPDSSRIIAVVVVVIHWIIFAVVAVVMFSNVFGIKRLSGQQKKPLAGKICTVVGIVIIFVATILFSIIYLAASARGTMETTLIIALVCTYIFFPCWFCISYTGARDRVKKMIEQRRKKEALEREKNQRLARSRAGTGPNGEQPEGIVPGEAASPATPRGPRGGRGPRGPAGGATRTPLSAQRGGAGRGPRSAPLMPISNPSPKRS